jgi:hypothetical protein
MAGLECGRNYSRMVLRVGKSMSNQSVGLCMTVQVIVAGGSSRWLDHLARPLSEYR